MSKKIEFDRQGKYNNKIEWTEKKKQRVIELIDKFVTTTSSIDGESACQNEDAQIESVVLYGMILDAVKPVNLDDNDEE